MVVKTIHPYIVKNEKILGNEPIIAETRTPVRAIIEYWRMGEKPEDMVRFLPHLNLSQIFDAMSYYFDNKEEIHRYIELNQIPKNKIHPLFQKQL